MARALKTAPGATQPEKMKHAAAQWRRQKGGGMPTFNFKDHAPTFAAVMPSGGGHWVYDKDKNGKVIGRHNSNEDPNLSQYLKPSSKRPQNDEMTEYKGRGFRNGTGSCHIAVPDIASHIGVQKKGKGLNTVMKAGSVKDKVKKALAIGIPVAAVAAGAYGAHKIHQNGMKNDPHYRQQVGQLKDQFGYLKNDLKRAAIRHPSVKDKMGFAASALKRAVKGGIVGDCSGRNRTAQQTGLKVGRTLPRTVSDEDREIQKRLIASKQAAIQRQGKLDAMRAARGSAPATVAAGLGRGLGKGLGRGLSGKGLKGGSTKQHTAVGTAISQGGALNYRKMLKEGLNLANLRDGNSMMMNGATGYLKSLGQAGKFLSGGSVDPRAAKALAAALDKARQNSIDKKAAAALMKAAFAASEAAQKPKSGRGLKAQGRGLCTVAQGKGVAKRMAQLCKSR